jgi:hypothetical protein
VEADPKGTALGAKEGKYNENWLPCVGSSDYSSNRLLTPSRVHHCLVIHRYYDLSLSRGVELTTLYCC